MTLIDKIKKTWVGLAIAGAVALPQGIDYVVNGPYKVTQVGNGISKRIFHEYKDKIVLTGWAHPFGSMMVDYGKDGSLDEYWLRSVSPRFPISIKIDPSSGLFQARQEEYVNLRGR